LTTSSHAAGQSALRSLSRFLGTERLVTHNVLVGTGTIAAGLLGVGFQSLVSHQLKPADYGAVFAVVTLITFIGLPASAFSLLMARETSRGQASGHHAASLTLLRRGNRALLLTGAGLASVLAIVSPLLAKFFNVPVELVLAAAVGVPFSVAMPLLVGEFQGEQRFAAYSLLMITAAGLKLVAAIALGVVLGPLGVIAGISLATIATYLLAVRLLRRRLSIKANLPWWRPATRYLAVVLPSTLALAVLLSSDVLLVKHFFPTHDAGEYSAVAAIGRAIFWGAGGIAAVLFPKVIFRATQGGTDTQIVGASLVLVAFGGLSGLVLLSVISKQLLTAFAGSAYSAAAGLLPWYAVGMTLLGGVAVLIATHQSRGRAGFLALLVPLTLLEPALLVIFHQNLTQVVQVVDISAAMILVSLGGLYLIEERARALSSMAVVLNGSTDQRDARVGVNQ
jgi:O-antigen/teichoic acid export membrane protein